MIKGSDRSSSQWDSPSLLLSLPLLVLPLPASPFLSSLPSLLPYFHLHSPLPSLSPSFFSFLPLSHFLPIFTKGLLWAWSQTWRNYAGMNARLCQQCGCFSKVSPDPVFLTQLFTPCSFSNIWNLRQLKLTHSCEECGFHPQLIISRHIRDAKFGQLPREHLCERYLERHGKTGTQVDLLSWSPTLQVEVPSSSSSGHAWGRDSEATSLHPPLLGFSLSPHLLRCRRVSLLNRELLDLTMCCFYRHFTSIIINKNLWRKNQASPTSKLRAQGFPNHSGLLTRGPTLALREIYYTRTFLAL